MSNIKENAKAKFEEIYGCDINDFMKSVREADVDYMMAAMSVLSDAQEELARGMDERARQSINRAKFLISDVYSKLGREKLEELSQ